jgi:GTPase SAR1 family protein
MIVFAVDNCNSFENAIKKWYPELKNSNPEAVIIFVGNKIDMRSPE